MPRPAVPGPTYRHAALLGLGVVSLFFACAAPAAKSDKICTPAEYYYCRCRDRSEGQHVCRDDGRSFGPCEPCVDSVGADDDDYYDDGGYEEPDAEVDEDAPVSSSLCGDGVIEQGEDCDDNNGDDNDGCNSECKLAGETPFKTNACPGLEVHVWGGKHMPTLAATTVGSGDRHVTTPCGSTTGDMAPDRIFRVVAHATGTMKVTTSNLDFDVFLWASATCVLDEGAYLVCADGPNAANNDSLSFAVQAGKTYYVYVDGAGSDGGTEQGHFRVTFSIQ